MRLTLIFICLILVGCSPRHYSQSHDKSTMLSLPTWVTNPSIEQGFAVTECIEATNKEANELTSTSLTLARIQMERTISQGLMDMDRAYRKLVGEERISTKKDIFKAASKSITKRTLLKINPRRHEYVARSDQSTLYCVMIALKNTSLRLLFHDILEAASVELTPDKKIILWENFLGNRIEKDLADLIEMEK